MIDFPSSPAKGDKFNSGTGPIYVFDGVAWCLDTVPIKTAANDNKVVNPSMTVSNEWGLAAGTTNGYHPADQWFMGVSTTGVISAQRIVTPAGSKSSAPYRLRFTVTTADTSLAAGEYAYFGTKIEGLDCADLKWGQADAKQVVLRFGFKGPAGTYSVGFRNGAGDRAYKTNFTISAAQANTEIEYAFAIPGDVTGTWNTDTTVGLMIDFCLAAGSNLVGVNGWQAGNMLAAAGITNNIATVNNVFEVWDVGLYRDPDFTGIPPAYVVPDFADEQIKCMRYYQKFNSLLLFMSYVPAGGQLVNGYSFPVVMRSSPTQSYFSVSYSNCATLTTNGVAPDHMMVQAVGAAAGTAYSGFSVHLYARM